MVRIGIEASERIGLACEAEVVAGPANVSATQCRERPLNSGQIFTATVRYWPMAEVRRDGNSYQERLA
jgi:hypothetical protein